MPLPPLPRPVAKICASFVFTVRAEKLKLPRLNSTPYARARDGRLMNFRKRKISRYSTRQCFYSTRIDLQISRRAVRLVLINERAKGMQIAHEIYRIATSRWTAGTNRRLFLALVHPFFSALFSSVVVVPLSLHSVPLFFSRARISLSKTYRRGFFSASVIYQSPSFSAAPHLPRYTRIRPKDLGKETRRWWKRKGVAMAEGRDVALPRTTSGSIGSRHRRIPRTSRTLVRY